MVVWKATLNPLMQAPISVPKGAEFLTAGEQFGEVCVWFRCDPSKKVVERQWAIVGTGHNNCPGPEAKYVGSAILDEGRLVLHVFVWPEGAA